MILRVHVFLLAPSIKFILYLKIGSCYLKNIWLDPVYCNEHCGLYLLFQERIFGKIFKIYCWNITESLFSFWKITQYRERCFKALGIGIH